MTASEHIDRLIAETPDWRGKLLNAIRTAILATEVEIVEEWKWKGSPVWSCEGIIVVGNAHKNKVKLTFYKGAELKDPDGLFNASLDGNAWRAIDFFEGDALNMSAFQALICDAAALNHQKAKHTKQPI